MGDSDGARFRSGLVSVHVDLSVHLKTSQKPLSGGGSSTNATDSPHVSRIHLQGGKPAWEWPQNRRVFGTAAVAIATLFQTPHEMRSEPSSCGEGSCALRRFARAAKCNRGWPLR